MGKSRFKPCEAENSTLRVGNLLECLAACRWSAAQRTRDGLAGAEVLIPHPIRATALVLAPASGNLCISDLLWSRRRRRRHGCRPMAGRAAFARDASVARAHLRKRGGRIQGRGVHVVACASRGHGRAADRSRPGAGFRKDRQHTPAQRREAGGGSPRPHGRDARCCRSCAILASCSPSAIARDRRAPALVAGHRGAEREPAADGACRERHAHKAGAGGEAPPFRGKEASPGADGGAALAQGFGGNASIRGVPARHPAERLCGRASATSNRHSAHLDPGRLLLLRPTLRMSAGAAFTAAAVFLPPTAA